MEIEVKAPPLVEEGQHVGVITKIEYRTDPFEYTDVFVEVKSKEDDIVELKYGCPTHSRLVLIQSKSRKRYPDMKLYEEILFLKQWFKGKWCVENVISYYDPLIKPQLVGNHYFWGNFNIPNIKVKSRMHNSSIKDLEKRKGFKLDQGKVNTILALRNCVEPELGKHILDCARKKKQKTLRDMI